MADHRPSDSGPIPPGSSANSAKHEPAPVSEPEPILPAVLLGQTVVTGLVDSVSFLALGHVFTANMTGNIVFLAFASAGAPGLSIPRSALALLAFLAGAVAGGRLAARMSSGSRRRWIGTALSAETALLVASAGASIGTGEGSSDTSQYAVIVLTALGMGVRNATVRRLGVPDLTTTVLTLTLAGVAADSSLAGGSNPRWRIRIASVACMFLGAVFGALLLRSSLAAPLVASAILSAGCTATAFRRLRGSPG